MSDSRAADPRAREIAIGELLSIDVHAELRKLAEAQLEGPWLIPVELVREALARGASRVDVDLGSDRAMIQDDGGSVSLEFLRSIAQVLDCSSSPQARHEALSTLDARGARVWLALAATPMKRLRIVADDGVRATTLTVETGHTPELRYGPPRPGSVARNVVILEGVELQTQRARERLVTACAFAPADVRLDERPIPRERVVPHRHPEFAVEAPLGATFPGTLFVRREGEGMRVRVLFHGVVATTVTLPRAPAVDVALEISSLVSPRATVTDMVARIESMQSLLAMRAVALLIELARGRRGEVAAARLLSIFLAASRHASIPELDELELVDAVEPDGTGRRISLADLRRMSAERRGVPVRDPSLVDDGIPTIATVVLLDEPSRAALSERFGISFRAPPSKARFAASSRLRRLAALRDRVLEAISSPLWTSSPAVPPEGLSTAERSAHATLIALAGPAGPYRAIQWREGKARSRVHDGVLLLWRAHPDVQGFVAAVQYDPNTLYPRALLLLGGRTVFEGSLRADFVAQMSARRD